MEEAITLIKYYYSLLRLRRSSLFPGFFVTRQLWPQARLRSRGGLFTRSGLAADPLLVEQLFAMRNPKNHLCKLHGELPSQVNYNRHAETRGTNRTPLDLSYRSATKGLRFFLLGFDLLVSPFPSFPLESSQTFCSPSKGVHHPSK